MILNVSGRTDIVAFYTEWFINRYKEGYVDVRNPFNPSLVSRIKIEYDEKQVKNNIKQHDKKSSLLIGELKSNDIIKERIK